MLRQQQNNSTHKNTHKNRRTTRSSTTTTTISKRQISTTHPSVVRTTHNQQRKKQSFSTTQTNSFFPQQTNLTNTTAFTPLQKRFGPIGSTRRYNPATVFGTPTYKMTTTERSEYLLDCDRRSIEQGISLLFGDWDQDLVVINKPFGVPMGASHRDSIGARIKAIVQHDSFYPVHRLDKYTSGCLVIAFKAEVARVLQFSLQNHTLASIKTTKSNLHQKVKHGQVKEHIVDNTTGNVLSIPDPTSPLMAKPEQHSTPLPKHTANDADTAWSKRYRVMVQLSPCLQRDIKNFMEEQYEYESKLDPNTPKIDFNKDIQQQYLDYMEKFNKRIENDKNVIATNDLIESNSKKLDSNKLFHSPDIIRSPHQEGTLYTPIYSVRHRHDENQHQDLVKNIPLSKTVPSLLGHGYLHSHLTQRDFFPTDWVQQHDIVHVDHINTTLENRLKSQRLGLTGNNSLHTNQSSMVPETLSPNSLPSLSYTSAVGVPGLDDVRVPQGHSHGSALYIETPNSQLEKVDLSSTPGMLPEDSINMTKKHPDLLPKLQTVLDQHTTHGLRNVRDGVEYRLLVPGAPRPPDNEDDDAEDQNEINKHNVFNAEDFQSALSKFTSKDFQTLPLDERKTQIYNFFARLCTPDGVAIAPFHWINAKIQLFEKVVKMHAVGKIDNKLIKTVFRKSESGDLYAPDFSIASAGPTMMNTVGKLLMHDTTDTKNSFKHERKGAVVPLDQNGDVVHVHTSDVFFADKDKILSPNTIQIRQHPLFWTSHRVLLRHNVESEVHPLRAFNQWSKITTDGEFPHHLDSTSTQPIPPALQPYELPCGCLLPYATPLPRQQKLKFPTTDTLANPHSLIPHLPPSAPHPFIPTNYLYESVPPWTERNKFIPNKNIASLPQNIPSAIMEEFEQKRLDLEISVAHNEKLKQQLDEKIVENTTQTNTSNQDGASAENILALNKTLKTRMKQKQERNNSRVVPYNYYSHNNHETNQFGSLLSSSEFDPNNKKTTIEDNQPEPNPSWSVNVSKRSAIRGSTARIPTTASNNRVDNTSATSGSENVMVSVPNQESKEATTLYRLFHLNVNKGFGIYNAKLLSGRTHQLRIHFSDAGLPIRGDPYYNPYYIKHWTGASMYAYYQKQKFNQFLRSIYLLPLFGHCDSGVTTQMLSADVWDALITPNVVPEYGGSILRELTYNAIQKQLAPHTNTNNKVINKSTTKDLDIHKISPDHLLSITPYTKKSNLLNQLTECFDAAEDNLISVANTSTSLFNNKLQHQKTNRITSIRQTNRDANDDQEQEEEEIVIPPPSPDEREVSDEELEQYLAIYKAFADKEIDGEMFLQSYLIEFPLPTAIRPPKHLRQVSNRKVRSEELQQKYLESLLKQEQQQKLDSPQGGVEGNDTSTNNNPEDDKQAEIESVLAQAQRPPFSPRVTLLNPTLDDGLPLYHNRMSKEDVKAERAKRKEAKKLHRQRTDALNTLVETSMSAPTTSIISTNDGADADSHIVSLSPVQTGESVITFADTHSGQPTYSEQATQFFNSPDNLDQYISFDQDGNEISNPTEHPDGFTEIQPLFSSDINPIWAEINKFRSSDIMKANYDPSKQVAVATVQPGQQFQTDADITMTYAGKPITTKLSHILHLSTEHRSWTYRTAQGTEMVRILIGVPASWGYAM